MVVSESLVYTPQGPRCVESLRPGDPVFGLRDGRLQDTTIRSVTPCEGRRTLFRVGVRGHFTVGDGRQKLAVVSEAADKFSWVSVATLSRKRAGLIMVPARVPREESKELSALLTPDHCWLLGAFCGGADQDVGLSREVDREKFHTLYEKLVGRPVQGKLYGAWGPHDAKWLALLLETMGPRHVHHTERQVPNLIWQLPEEQQKAFVFGYLAVTKHQKQPARETRVISTPALGILKGIEAIHNYNGWVHTGIIAGQQLANVIWTIAIAPGRVTDRPGYGQIYACERKFAQLGLDYTRFVFGRPSVYLSETESSEVCYTIRCSSVNNVLVDGLFLAT